MEGATENIVEKLYGEKYSTDSEMRFNFSNMASYPYQVSMIRQMEYALGMDADESILYGKMDFFNKFSEKYGKDALRVISHRANRLLPTEKARTQFKTGKEEIEYFEETQNIILHSVFDREFERLNSTQDIERYFSKLQGFETTRGKKMWENDISFQSYYNEKLKLIQEKLIQKGYGENYVKLILEKHKYQKQKFNPFKTYATTINENSIDEYSQSFALVSRAYELIDEEHLEEHLKDYRFYRGKYGEYDDEFFHYLVMTKEGKPCIIHYVNNFGGRKNIKIAETKDGLEFKDTEFIQDSDSITLNTEGRQVSLEEFDISPNLELVRSKIEELKEKRRKMKEQKTSLRIVAKTQRLSVINRVISEIKSAFRNRDVAQNHSMEDEQR